MNANVRTAARFPGHKIISIVLALGVWSIGVYFTARALPIDAKLGTITPYVVAFLLQGLLSLAQSNLRTFGISLDRWPFLAMVFIDVVLNWSGLLVVYIDSVVTTSDSAMYVLHAASTGSGLWQSFLTFAIGALIAASPEAMVRDALRR